MILRSGSSLLSRISISTQLLVWFLCLSLIPCVVLTGAISILSTQSLKRTVRQGLLAISDAKTTQLETYIRERRADLDMASRYPVLVDAIPKLNQVLKKESIDS
jgi:methyl-accepting chemotaxis protein WspA